MPQYVVAPNFNQIAVYWRYSGGPWIPLACKRDGVAIPRKVGPKIEMDSNEGYVISAHVTEFAPLPMGSLVVYDIQPTATAYTFRDAVLGINGGEAATPTNGAASVTVQSEARCFDLRFDTDQGSSRGGVLTEIMLCVFADFSAGPKGSATGATYDVPLTVFGTITTTLPA